MTEATQERVENARKRLDIAEKWELPTMDPNFFAIVELADEVKKLSDMNASLGTMINNKIVEIKGLKSQLAALKERHAGGRAVGAEDSQGACGHGKN